MRHSLEGEYESFVRAHRGSLVATARVLAGDPHLAEDIVQSALVKLYLAWGRARRTRVEAYARRILINCFIDHQRTGWVLRERTAERLPDTTAPGAADATTAGIDADPALVAALAALPPRMRAVVVLRHVLDLSVDDVADALNCSTGTVKSQNARALDKLRAILTDPQPTGGNR